jgi:hypothetical protein
MGMVTMTTGPWLIQMTMKLVQQCIWPVHLQELGLATLESTYGF